MSQSTHSRTVSTSPDVNNPTMKSDESGKKVLGGGERAEKDVVEGIEKIVL